MSTKIDVKINSQTNQHKSATKIGGAKTNIPLPGYETAEGYL